VGAGEGGGISYSGEGGGEGYDYVVMMWAIYTGAGPCDLSAGPSWFVEETSQPPTQAGRDFRCARLYT
jgi:hypothetical protein